MREHFLSFGKHSGPPSQSTSAGPPVTITKEGGGLSPVDQANVLSRLHALFNTSHPFEDGHESLPQLSNEQVSPVADGLISPGMVVDREAIKVLVVTWNMGDALPKGDLSVLFGEIPHYTPASPTDALPPLGVENNHPYHLVVVAGQECPTHSGVPRGLGGGLMKGVHVRPGHRKDREDKLKEKDEDGGDEKEKEPSGIKSPLLGDTDEDSAVSGSVPSPSPTPAPMPSTPTLHRHNPQPGSKGWSTMLDDWFCGPPPNREQIPESDTNPDAIQTHPLPSPVLSPRLDAPAIIRSSSAPGSSAPGFVGLPTSTDPMHIPIPANLLSSGLRHSPLALSITSSPSSSSASSPEFETPPNLSLPPPGSRPKAASTNTNRPNRPEIIIPNDEPVRTKDGEGCYLHLVKERLMGMYLSVYVYKGCEHLVQGVDKDFVTAGLAGGRVGNKGGIGISVKLADHSFLFVNSHLAAHTARVDARIANVEKIKSELRLDAFLPKDDPRNELEDLTDRFDTVFWCGDLNFRLDLSRLHAEWLVEQKKYDEALMWDQLRAVMRDNRKNPFPGFQEHTIDFPPTFKYDVWRSIKTTNRELRRSLRRRGTIEGKDAKRPFQGDVSPRLGPQSNLSHVPEAETHEELAEDKDDDQDAEDDDQTLASRKSFESTTGGYTSAAPSTAGTDGDGDSDDFATSVDATAYGSRHKALEVALKEKTKHFLSLVKMDKVLSPSPSKRRAGRSRSVSRKLREKQSMEFDTTSRRTSMSSMASFEPGSVPGPQGGWSEQETAVGLSMSSSKSNGTSDLPLGPPRRPSDASARIGSSPNQQVMRRFSMLKRSVSGRSVKEESRTVELQEQGVGADDIDESVDYREGVYDSSKKQRVPSWCDRVLWKAHVVPDENLSVEDDITAEPHSRLSNRLSTAFASFGGHLRLSMTRTGSIEPTPTDRISNLSIQHLNRPLPPTPPDSETVSIVTSPQTSPTLQPTRVTTGDGNIPSPKRPASRPSPTHSRLLTHTLNRSSSGSLHHPLLDTALVQASPPAFPKITFDPALPAEHDRSPLSPTTSHGRPRANSDSIPPPGLPKRTLSAGSGSGLGLASGSSLRKDRVVDPELRRTSGGSLKMRTRTKTLDQVPSLALTRPENLTHLSTGTYPLSIPANLPEDRKSFVKFIRDIPHWLHTRSATSHSDLAPPSLLKHRYENRRHLQGEVVCLHYGTIDDAGMRRLEGRSDHRPAIFAAAVYV